MAHWVKVVGAKFANVSFILGIFTVEEESLVISLLTLTCHILVVRHVFTHSLTYNE